MSEITLTEDQKEVFDNLHKFITVDPNDMALLEGCAGSGKTTLVKELVYEVLGSALFSNIAMVAPTWKAVKVMRKMCPDDIVDKIAFSSLHSLLGLKHTITPDGKEIFVKDQNTISKFHLYDLIIVDEASMIANQLFEEIVDQNYRNVKVLFVGDSNQINPVNHAHAIPMLEEKREEYKIMHFKLTKIIRQAEGNPIIKISQKILNKTFKFENGEKDLNTETNEGVVMISRNQNAVINKLLTYYFCSDQFDMNADFCKVIAWRNIIVDEFNSVIRKLKYGLKAPKIVIDEKLIVDRPIKKEGTKEIEFTTNEDLVVKSVEIKEKNLFGKIYKYYNVEVNGDVSHGIIHIIHEDSEKLYRITLDELSQAAKRETDNFKRVEKWRNYFSFMENFAQVKYNYAITAHCAQGSTYDNCFVYYSDIALNRNHNERDRITYTAFTRPKTTLYIM